MALSDVIKKKQATGAETEGAASKTKKNPLDDVRIVIAIILVASVALIALIVYTTGLINKKNAEIDEVKTKYQQNQQSIANLMALQAQSGEYLKQREEYDKMISSEPIDKMQIFMNLEDEVGKFDCIITGDVEIEDPTNNGLVNQAAITMTIVGEYTDIMRYCQYVANGDPIRRIDSITIKERESSETLKEAELTIVVFSK